MFELTREQFLEKKRISEEVWEKSGCDWAVLRAIADDHVASHESLVATAELFARTLQRMDAVHSVRFRVKDVEHLLEKIVRKCAEDEPKEKYKAISVDNYHQVVTDLVGIRALHLFKDDCFAIDESIRREWRLYEEPVAYVRVGDSAEFRKELSDHGLQVQDHKAGYRSVHYVATTRPGKREVLVEVQVRTIFEEGWSEIDHTVRYPNFTDDPLIEYFLTIFNRIAGAADEMGGFVKLLSAYSVESSVKQSAIEKERDNAIASMEEALQEAQTTAKQSADQRKLLDKLTQEVGRLRQMSESSTGAAYEPFYERALLRVLNTSSGHGGPESTGLTPLELERAVRRLSTAAVSHQPSKFWSLHPHESVPKTRQPEGDEPKDGK